MADDKDRRVALLLDLQARYRHARQQMGADRRPDEPSMTILERTMMAAPAFPLQVLGPFWERWVSEAARAANAPVDFVSMPLLCGAGSLVGNARRPRIGGWTEPTALWGAGVGGPSSGKSPGLGAVLTPIEQVECAIAADFPNEMRNWRHREAMSKAALRAWEADVARAARAKAEPPSPPAGLELPARPVRPRVRLGDITPEKAQQVLARLPRGAWSVHDELANWFAGHTRYNASATAFWLEAYTGRTYSVDRVKFDDTLVIPHLSVGVYGGVQPDRLAALVADRADDGLLARFLWAWPNDLPPFRLPERYDAQEAARRLQRLAGLAMPTGPNGEPVPGFLDLDATAAAAVAGLATRMDARTRDSNASGLFLSACGKARGQMLRLALILQCLWWCAGPDAQREPEQVDAAAAEAAAHLMEAYFLPMAERVYCEADEPRERRHARALARWILGLTPGLGDGGRVVVNVRAIREHARLPGLRKTSDIEAALSYLAQAGWAVSAEWTGAAGRPRNDWIINPKVYGWRH